MKANSSSSPRRFGAWRVLRSGWCWTALLGLGLLLLTARTLEAQQQPASGAVTLASLQAQVTALKDRQDILDALKRYTRGIDRHDKDLVRSAFWPEARIDLGTPMGLEEYVDHEEKLLAEYAAHQHHVTGQTVDLQGNTAHVESYVLFIAVPRDKSGDAVGRATPGRALTGERTDIGSGRYLERWEKRNGEWKILVREYIHDLSVEGETVDYCGKRPCLGRWDRTDLSYQRPLVPLTLEERKALGDVGRKTRSPEKR